MRRSADDVALDEGHAGSKAGRPAGSLVAARASPDDDYVGHAPSRHGTSVMAAESWHLGRDRCQPSGERPALAP